MSSRGSCCDPVGLAGLLFESATGLRRLAGPRFEQAHDLPHQSFDVLVRLARSPGQRLRMSDLAAQCALTPSGLTRAVDRLSEAGLVARDSCAEDKRGSFASLTPLGRERMDRALCYHATMLEEILDGALAREEQELLMELLARLRDRLNPAAARLGPTQPKAAAGR